MQQKKAVWPWVVAGVVVLGGAGWWMFRDDVQALRIGSDPAPHAIAEPPAVAPSTPATATPPAERHPLDRDTAADPALPRLQDSDASAWEALTALLGAPAVQDRLLREHLIQRMVTYIDNLTQPSVPSSVLVMRPLPGELQRQPDGDGVVIAADNSARYAPYVAAFTHANADALAAAYVRFYPLIQQAYRQTSKPDAHFNDRLVAVIDHLLQTPEPTRPLRVVVDERGKFRFVDPDLQSRSVGQKALLRLDATQAREVKQQLRALRAAIARH